MAEDSVRAPRRHRRLRPALAAALVAVLAWPVPFAVAPAAAQQAPGEARFQELDPMPLLPGAGDFSVDKMGWLILDTKHRFAYQVFEKGDTTVVQSFDLDTLRPRRRLVLAGIPILGSDRATVGGASSSGDLVHAVDEEAGRLYLAMSNTLASFRGLATIGSVDGKRDLVRFVMIDEAAFDACGGQAGCAAVASFREPAGPQSRLHFFHTVGMAVTRHHVPPGRPGRLVVTFAHPAPPPGGGTVVAAAHTVVQWDVGGLRPVAGHEQRGAELDSEPLAVDPARPPEERVLDVCSRSSMASTYANSSNLGQWELLATADALFVVCQAAEASGMVVEVPLGPGGTLVTPERLRIYPLSKPVAHPIADQAGQRLLLKTADAGTNTGSAVWVFDARKARYTGALAMTQAHDVDYSLGLDPATGRLYTLLPDYGAQVAGSKDVPQRGGLQYSDSRLDPVPPLENVRPDMAYPSMYRILVDPPTRRVFVRRGHASVGTRAIYPDPDIVGYPAPPEHYYRVFRDNVPVLGRPPELDDSAFTTDVAESELTTASYSASGSGFGSRVLLTGGLQAATSGAAGGVAPGCSKDDRELVAGAVEEAALSDLAASAGAAGLTGDPRLATASPELVDRCSNASTPTDTEGLAFDEVDPETGKRTGENHYRAFCLGDEGAKGPRGFRASRPQDGGFEAEATCNRAEGRVGAEATGALAVPAVDQAQDGLADQVEARRPGTAPTGTLRVGHSHSEVTVRRKEGGGIEVRVDSIARGIDIPGVGSIAVVRTESVATATGRVNRAGASFTRTICGAKVSGQSVPPDGGCLSGGQEQAVVEAFNAAMGTRGRARLREPDARALAGSPSGYRAGVERDRDDKFEDRDVTRDYSPAVPGLELMFFQGDGNSQWGTGRQVVQLAGAQAATGYGISCRFGQRADGRCARLGEETVELDTPTFGGTGGEGGAAPDPIVTTITETLPGEEAALPVVRTRESLLTRLLRAPVRAVAEAVGLLFSNPRELGLLAAVWLLLYAPFHLGERYRNIRRLRARPA